MNVIQSYLTTIINGDFSLYEIRLFTKIVETANKELEGKRIKDLDGPIKPIKNSSYDIVINYSDVLTEGSNDVQKVRNAAESLSRKQIRYYSRKKAGWVDNSYKDKDGTTNYLSRLVEEVKYTNGTGYMVIKVSYWLMCYILDVYQQRFSMYDLGAALTLPTAYCVRMYWLVASSSKPVQYPIQMLRDMLGVGKKYPSTKDFIKRCIETPRRILADKGLNGYNYQVIHKFAESKTSKIVALVIIPIQRELKSDTQIAAKAPLSIYCPIQLRQYLQSQCAFTDKDLHALKLELADFSKLSNYLDRIVRIVNHARAKGAGKGYIINAMRDEIAGNRMLLAH